MGAIDEYGKLRKSIDELKIKSLAAKREKERLEAEFEELKSKIKEEYGVELEDFEKAIVELEKELAAGVEELKSLISDCNEKVA